MPTVNVTNYGAVPNDETFDNGPAFFAAAKAAKTNGTVILPIGTWHIRTFPAWTGAFPRVQADANAFIEYHLDTDYNGTPSPEAIQNFVTWHGGFGVPYAWRLLGLGVTET